MILSFVLELQIGYVVAKVLGLKKKKFSKPHSSVMARRVSGSVQLRWGKPQKEFSALCMYSRKRLDRWAKPIQVLCAEL